MVKYLGLVDLDLGSYPDWWSPNLSQPNQGTRPPESPCMYKDFRDKGLEMSKKMSAMFHHCIAYTLHNHDFNIDVVLVDRTVIFSEGFDTERCEIAEKLRCHIL